MLVSASSFVIWLTAWAVALYFFAPASRRKPTQPDLPVRWPECFLYAIPHGLIAMFGGVIAGFIPEMVFARVVHGSPLEPYAPAICVVAMLLGFYVAPKLLPEGALLAWLPGALWLAYGMWSESKHWSPSWSHVTSRWQYAVNNFLTTRCGSTECLGELIFTYPFAASVAYTVGALVQQRAAQRSSITPATC